MSLFLDYGIDALIAFIRMSTTMEHFFGVSMSFFCTFCSWLYGGLTCFHIEICLQLAFQVRRIPL